MNKIKFNIIMPSYNDAGTIVETLDSIKTQKYDNWFLTIVNDGSSDNTEEVVKKYIKDNHFEEKINYLYEENSDQLNAIKYALTTINDKDSIIYILHSDDLFANDEVLLNAADYFNNHDVDAIMSDLNIIDEDSKDSGVLKVKKYRSGDKVIALQGLWLGRNLFVDVAFWKYDVYVNYVKNSYLDWNIPAWIQMDATATLKIDKVYFPCYKYRVFSGNYINNEVGLLCVLSGEVRNQLNILKKYSIPCYKVQYFLFRSFNKLGLPYYPVYSKKETKNLYKVVKFNINKRIKDEDIHKYPFFESILSFYKNIDNNNTIEVIDVKEDDVFLGSDMRVFFKKMLKNELPSVYYDFFKNMNEGFKKIVTDKSSYDNVVNITKYLCIYNYIEIEVKEGR